jgi:predicted nucleic acid-binding Zn ribbon protein
VTDESPQGDTESASDLARTALARAKASARATPTKKAPVRRVQYGDDRDPQTIDTVMQGWLRDHGYESQVGSGSLVARWPEIVGETLADHVVPEAVRETADGRELVLRADSTAWATQVRLLIPTIHGRIRSLLGAGVVDRIRVSGPVPPARNPGPRRVPGRGPRDTYG